MTDCKTCKGKREITTEFRAFGETLTMIKTCESCGGSGTEEGTG